MEHVPVAEDGPPTVGIPDGLHLDEFDLSAVDPFELLAETLQVEEAPYRTGTEADEDVDVARRAEVVTRGRAEERELPDGPPAAERLDP
jgi:hypothetical protein